MGPGGFFPTNPDLADILGRMDFDFEIFFDFFGSQISGLGPTWAHPLGPRVGPPTWAPRGPTHVGPLVLDLLRELIFVSMRRLDSPPNLRSAPIL